MIIKIHPDNPQLRLIRQAADIVRKGGIIAYPTDSAYALGCYLGDKKAQDRIRQIRRLDEKHKFTLMCANLTDVSLYAKVNNTSYRLLKKLTPGAYTFILEATSEVPRRLQNPKRKTIGLRVPDNEIAQAIINEMGEPIMSVSLIMPNDDMPLNDAEEIERRLKSQIDMVVDGGSCSLEPTTVVHLETPTPEVTRVGKGDTAFLS